MLTYTKSAIWMESTTTLTYFCLWWVSTDLCPFTTQSNSSQFNSFTYVLFKLLSFAETQFVVECLKGESVFSIAFPFLRLTSSWFSKPDINGGGCPISNVVFLAWRLSMQLPPFTLQEDHCGCNSPELPPLCPSYSSQCGFFFRS